MSHNSSKVFGRITLGRQDIPTFSRLYNLQPIGIGTAFVESFTCIIARLAKAHCVTAGALIGWIIAPHLNKRYMLNVTSCSGGSILGGHIRGLIKTLNGKGAAASEWVQAYEDLTFSKGIRFLTLLPWAQVLSERYLLRSFRAWCPACFEEWRLLKREIFEPLLWLLNIVEICVNHRLRLRSRCPWCNSNDLPLLASNTQPGYCSKCKKWLGIASNLIASADQELSQEELNWQSFVTASIGEVIAAGPSITTQPTREKVRESVSACVNRYVKGNVTEFARFIQVSPSTVSNWYRGENVLQLDMLLQLCHRLGLSTLEFLKGNIINSNYSKLPDNQPSLPSVLQVLKRPTISEMVFILKSILKGKEVLSLEDTAKRYGHSRRNLRKNYPDLCHAISARYLNQRVNYWNGIRLTMQVAISEYPPPSVISFAARTGQSKSNLYKRFGSLCYEMAARHLEYRKDCSMKAQKQLVEEVRGVAQKLYADGIQPTQEKVSKLLSKAGSISNREARCILRKVKLSLG